MFKYLVSKYGYDVKILEHIKNEAIKKATYSDVDFNGDIDLIKKFMTPYGECYAYNQLLKKLNRIHYFYNFTAGDVEDFANDCVRIVMRVN